MGFLTKVKKKILTGKSYEEILEFVKQRPADFPPHNIFGEIERYLKTGTINPFYICDLIKHSILGYFEDIEAYKFGKQTQENIKESIKESFVFLSEDYTPPKN